MVVLLSLRAFTNSVIMITALLSPVNTIFVCGVTDHVASYNSTDLSRAKLTLPLNITFKFSTEPALIILNLKINYFLLNSEIVCIVLMK